MKQRGEINRFEKSKLSCPCSIPLFFSNSLIIFMKLMAENSFCFFLCILCILNYMNNLQRNFDCTISFQLQQKTRCTFLIQTQQRLQEGSVGLQEGRIFREEYLVQDQTHCVRSRGKNCAIFPGQFTFRQKVV